MTVVPEQGEAHTQVTRRAHKGTQKSCHNKLERSTHHVQAHNNTRQVAVKALASAAHARKSARRTERGSG